MQAKPQKKTKMADTDLQAELENAKSIDDFKTAAYDAIDNARSRHQAIPYAAIAEAVSRRITSYINDGNDKAVVNEFLNIR